MYFCEFLVCIFNLKSRQSIFQNCMSVLSVSWYCKLESFGTQCHQLEQNGLAVYAWMALQETFPMGYTQNFSCLQRLGLHAKVGTFFSKPNKMLISIRWLGNTRLTPEYTYYKSLAFNHSTQEMLTSIFFMNYLCACFVSRTSRLLDFLFWLLN